MTMQEIQRALATKPFDPFRVLTADGRHYDVRHPESIALAGKGRLISIGLADSFVVLDLLLVTALERPIPRRGNGNARRSRRA